MNNLRRELAPISDAAWVEIDAEAKRTITHFLAGRSLVDVRGPLGLDFSAVSLGRSRPATPAPVGGVAAQLRSVRPLVELRTPFELPIAELEAIDRGAPDPDLSPLQEAARLAALAEDRSIFHGYEPAGIVGIVTGSTHHWVGINDDYGRYPATVAHAVSELRRSGVGGPYALALGSRSHQGVIEHAEAGGYPLLEHLKLIVGGPVIWAPGVDGAAVVSTRGGDFELVLGEDFSVGYRRRTRDHVELYIEESFTLILKDDRAAIELRHGT